MALSGFEIAVGGMTSIPAVSGLIFLGYKSFGEKSLDASKLKPKKKPAIKKEPSAVEKATPAMKSVTSTTLRKPSEASKDRSSPNEQTTTTKDGGSNPIKMLP